MYLQSLSFYYDSKKNFKKHKKRIISLTINSITKVHILNNVELNFLPDMFYEFFCIFNQYRLITIFRNSKIFEKAIYFIVRPNFFPVKVPFRIDYIPMLLKNTVSLCCGGGASNPLLAHGLL